MDRFYKNRIENCLEEYSKMVFISGPRQVGKTTIAKGIIKNKANSTYLNWDYIPDRQKILNEAPKIFEDIVAIKSNEKTQIVLDEVHKFNDWKNLIKGFYDKFNEDIEFIITGSAKLNIYKKGGDSLMGRYINFTVHPLSVSELAGNYTSENSAGLRVYENISRDKFEQLLHFGGFVEPFLKSSERFHRIWSNQRFEQFFREDIRNIEDINNIYSLELLASILKEQASGLTNYTNLANKVRVSDQTVRRWLSLLEKHYYCFSIRPWSKNIARSFLKEPKYFLWDWSQVTDHGIRFENFIASHLRKAVDYWNERGFGVFSLNYIRDKQKREVDFVVTKNNNPWFLVEAKLKDHSISRSLKYFHNLINPEFSFQVVRDMQGFEGSCFDKPGVWVVPAITFLSELV